MNLYRSKVQPLRGTTYQEVLKKAVSIYAGVRRRSKRRPYIRSAYFQKQKIFLPLFWSHLNE